jgi:hypothetical protein
MEQSKVNQPLTFRVMVTFPNLLEKEINEYNKFYGTNFRITQTIYDEVIFCDIEVSLYSMENIFGLGYSLAAAQYTLKAKGEIEW